MSKRTERILRVNRRQQIREAARLASQQKVDRYTSLSNWLRYIVAHGQAFSDCNHIGATDEQ